MNFLISFCLNNRITVILLTIALAIISIFVVKNIPVDVFPELKVPRVTIQTEAPRPYCGRSGTIHHHSH